MTTEIYRGTRTKNGCCSVTINDQPLPHHFVTLYSAQAFDWGNTSIGSRHLALSLLARYCGSDEQRAIDNYDEFKNLVIAHIPCNTWLMDREYIEQMLRTIEHQNRRVAA
jgi:hypothetical protein